MFARAALSSVLLSALVLLFASGNAQTICTPETAADCRFTAEGEDRGGGSFTVPAPYSSAFNVECAGASGGNYDTGLATTSYSGGAGAKINIALTFDADVTFTYNIATAGSDAVFGQPGVSPSGGFGPASGGKGGSGNVASGTGGGAATNLIESDSGTTLLTMAGGGGSASGGPGGDGGIVATAGVRASGQSGGGPNGGAGSGKQIYAVTIFSSLTIPSCN